MATPRDRAQWRDALSTSFGFRVADSFVTFLETAQTIDLWKAINAEVRMAEIDLSAPQWAAHPMIYHTWQPEFFAFLSPGEDGITYGFVVHAPELQQDEWPVFESDPSGYNGDMVFLAETLPHALEMLVATDPMYSGRDEPLTNNPSYVALAARMGLSLERQTLRRRTSPEDCYVPHTPAGWRFEKCDDMIGVLAPAKNFAVEQPQLETFLDQHGNDPAAARAAMIHHARWLLADGFPASSLSGVRQLLHTSDLVVGERGELLDILADIYATLGRPVLERVTRDRILYEAAETPVTQTISVSSYAVLQEPEDPVSSSAGA
jgi:hypothetical protein